MRDRAALKANHPAAAARVVEAPFFSSATNLTQLIQLLEQKVGKMEGGMTESQFTFTPHCIFMSLHSFFLLSVLSLVSRFLLVLRFFLFLSLFLSVLS